MHDTQPSSNLQGKPAFTVLATLLIISLILLLHFTFIAPNHKPVANEQVQETKPEQLVPEKLAAAKAPGSIPQPQQVAVRGTEDHAPAAEPKEPPATMQEAELSTPTEVKQKAVEPLLSQEPDEVAPEEIVKATDPPAQPPIKTVAEESVMGMEASVLPAQISPVQVAIKEPKKDIEAVSVVVQENIIVYSVHAGSFKSLEQADSLVEKLRAKNYPSFLYTRTDKRGNLIYVVTAGKYGSRGLAREASNELSRQGFDNFVSRAKHSLYFGPPVSTEKTTIDKESKKFREFLNSLNSRYSRNSAVQEALKSWSIDTTFDSALTKINADRTFFHMAAGRQGLLMQPIATDLTVIQSLNLPIILAVYLPNHPWPRYLTIIGMDPDNVMFASATERHPIMVNRLTLLNYWSGEAYLIWKNYLDLQGAISKNSRSGSVKNLKQLLRDLGYQKISVNQSIDEETLLIIKNIQKKYGLREDGIVGPLTKIAIYNESDIFKKPTLTTLAQN